jgi:hypothetical protein
VTVLVMGDPQAPLAQMLAVLRARGALEGDGRLRPGISLISLGDHFDYGTLHAREDATRDAVVLVEWLASHPPAQVTLLLGNHDLARVGELADFDDAGYRAARAQADRLSIAPDAATEARFCQQYQLPRAEYLTRDLSCFSVAQRQLVTRLLRERRFRLAHAVGPLLCVHAGVTRETLVLLGLGPFATAPALAAALNSFLDSRVTNWSGGRLELDPLYRYANADSDSSGMLCHRPAEEVGPKRFHPRQLPPVMQAIGHIRDEKCRHLMPQWVVGPPAAPGALRSLWFDGEMPRYSAGIHSQARLLFCDGSMNVTAATDYELLDAGLLVAVR